jgi:hypothetical protein
MADLNWVHIGVGFVIGVFASYFVCDMVFPVRNKNDRF